MSPVPTVVRHARRSPWLPAFLAGTAAGALVGWWARRAEAEGHDGGDRRRGPRWDRLVLAWEGAVDRIARARDRVTGEEEEPDLPALAARLRALPGGDGVRLRDLGDGIVEVVGTAESEPIRRALLASVTGCPGVQVVVNRVWTPSSSRR